MPTEVARGMEKTLNEIHDALVDDAENYFTRNAEFLHRENDPVHAALRRIHLVRPMETILEIGCSTGWRLDVARNEFGARCTGLEAGAGAVKAGRSLYPDIKIEQGLAPVGLSQWVGTNQFSCIVLGFFVYLLPRRELFRLAADVDELLEDHGHLVIHDFLYPSSIRSPYTHHSSLATYKIDPSSPWTWSPNYCQVERSVYHANATLPALIEPDRWSTVDVLRKLPESVAYPWHDSQPSWHAIPRTPASE